MNNLKQFLMKSAKFILWFGLILASLLVVAAIVLPGSVIASDYLAGSPFPIGFTVTASILALVCLAIFVKSLRRIEANPTKIVIAKPRKTQKPKRKPINDVEFIEADSLMIQPKGQTAKVVPIKRNSDRNFFDEHEIIEID